jgi:hypothetical protein
MKFLERDDDLKVYIRWARLACNPGPTWDNVQDYQSMNSNDNPVRFAVPCEVDLLSDLTT